jgi:predicted RNA binding protein YcfA (HicA-like mRNA interferase family)
MAKLPQIKGNRLVGALRKRGWYVDRTSGSHVIMRNEQRPGIMVTVPTHGKPIKPGTLNNIVKQAELSIAELKELL